MGLNVDGVMVASNGTAANAVYTGYWRVGGDTIGGTWPAVPSSSHFNGSIDEVAVYLRALSPEQVQGHYARGVQAPPGDTTAPTAPGSLRAATSGDDVTLDWAASTDEVGVTGYTVHRSTEAGFTPSAATKVADVTGTGYTDLDRPAGTYYYRVTARDAAGNVSTPSTEAKAVVAAVDSTAPSVPGSPAATVNGTTVTLDWAASTDEVGVTGYTVHRSTEAGFTPSAATKVADVTGTGYTDLDRPVGTYYYRVTARDAAGNVSTPSTEAKAVVAGQTVEKTVSLTPTEDTYANQGAPSTNYGSSWSLASRGGSSGYTSYLKFTVPDAPAGGQLISAKLIVRTTSDSFAGSADAHSVTLSPTDWTETGLTWQNKPPLSDQLGSLPGATSPNATVTAVLDAAKVNAKGAGALGVAITSTSSDNLWFWSRSSTTASHRPTLILTYQVG